MKLSLQKNADLTRFFIIKPIPRSTKDTDLGGKNPQWELWSYAAKRPRRF